MVISCVNISSKMPGFSDLAIVLLTARGQAADLEMGEAVGADRYLVKPFSPLQLVQTVRELTQ